MSQVKFVEDSLLRNLLGPFVNTLSQVFLLLQLLLLLSLILSLVFINMI